MSASARQSAVTSAFASRTSASDITTKNAVVTHRYRLRAATGSPPGTNPILNGLIDTDADTRVFSTSLAQSTIG
jgi:hypothetical protein